MIDTKKNIQTKEAIASRMFLNAAAQWGVTGTSLDNFDPLVRLLIEACAVEMYKLGNQIESTQERMIERLAGLLTPEVYTLPRPAHGILHARAIDAVTTLSKNAQFYYHKKIASKANGPLDSNLDIFFSPAGAYKLVDGDVRIIASGNHIYQINDAHFQKEVLARTDRPLPYRTVWLGLELSNYIEDITQLSLFFDFRNIPDRNKYLSLIHYTACSINDTPVHFHKGLYDLLSRHEGDGFKNSLEELYINKRLEHFTAAFYKDQFITISGENEFLRKPVSSLPRQKYPVEFEEVLSASELSEFNKDLLWVKLVFRPEFTSTVLDDIMVSINCFPVMNRHLNEITYRLQSFFNIIPLLSQEQFLSVNKVESTSPVAKGDKEYKFYPFDQFDNSQKGTYTIRTGEMQRFDSRNAMEYMNYLVELLRDESRAFAALGQDFIASTIKHLNQNITQIEQKIKQNTAILNNNPAYMLVNPVADGDTIFTQFWTTNGELANHVRSGSRVELYEGAQFKKEGMVMMTTTTGGSNKLKNTETLAAYKNVLISRGRIVTQEDIKSFCRYFLQGKADIKSLEVKKGVGLSARPAEGLIPTVDISIVPQSDTQLSKEEWNAVKHELLVNLEEQSAVDLNYRVFVN